MAESANTRDFTMRSMTESDDFPPNRRKKILPQDMLKKINNRGHHETKYRAAGLRHADTDHENLGYVNTDTYGKTPDGRSGPAKNRTVPTATKSDLSLMYLTSTLEDPKELHDQVYDTISNLKDCDLTELDYAVLGVYYFQGKFVEFLVGCFLVEGQLIIEMKRMYGDGFLMLKFYEELKSKLEEREVVLRTEEDSESDFEYSESESGEAEDDDELLNYGYLQLQYDPSMISSWVKKIAQRHDEDQMHLAGMMAHNASNKQNLDIIVTQGGIELRNLLVNKLENSNIAPLVCMTAVLAKYVTQHPKCKNHGYDEEHVLLSIFDAMKYWHPGKEVSSKNRQQSTKFEVTESRETVNNLVQTIYNLGEMMKIIPKETLVKVARDRLEKKPNKKDSPKDTLLRFLKKQEQTKAVMYFLDILAQI